jgi:hypothetical protein
MINRSGLSYARLARAIRAVAVENGVEVRTNSAAVAHWVAGVRPAPETIGFLVEALARAHRTPLSAAHIGPGSDPSEVAPGGDLIDDLVSLGGADVERRVLTQRAAVMLGQFRVAAS